MQTSLSRVVITGAGIITALGQGWKTNLEGFRTGRTAFRKISLFDVSRQRVQVAAQIDLPARLPATGLTRRQEQRLDRAAKLLLIGCHEAWTEAGWTGDDAIPIVLGTTSGGMSKGEAYLRHALEKPHGRRGQPTRVIEYLAHSQALSLCKAFHFSGPITIIGNACASGANAIGHAWMLLRHRRAERVLAGGYDALSQLVFAGFDSLQALSPTSCRPFDAARDGLALGEGAAVLTLETLEYAQRRGARIFAEIAGYGAATDAHHLTQPHPEGEAALAAMEAACASAGVQPGQIGYVNAHGTGTPLNDTAEAAAINRWAGSTAERLPVSSTKASIGHLLGAAGAVEALVCLMALREQMLPPSATVETPDPMCRFRLVRKPMEGQLEYALSNSFGFGGANATLILRR